MGIRPAQTEDGETISDLLDQLGYPQTLSFIHQKIGQMLQCPDERLLVYEKDGQAIAFISFHFIPQIALPGDFARISYLAVDREYRSRGIGRALLEYCTELARERKCDRIEVHTHARRTEAHRFYFRERYEESPKYLIKMLVDEGSK